MRQQMLLPLGGADIRPAANDHVFDATFQAQQTLGIERSAVTGVVPAVWVDRDRRPLLIAPVSEHGAVTSLADLAFLTSWDRLAGFLHDSDLHAVESGPAVRDHRQLLRAP